MVFNPQKQNTPRVHDIQSVCTSSTTGINDNKTVKIFLKNNQREKLFKSHYEELKQFIKKNDKLPSYSSTNEEEKKIACWCAVKRSEMRSNKLEEYAISKLNKIKVWTWGCTKNTFSENLKIVKKWSENNNNKIPSYASKDKNEKKMAMWCNLMRQQKKENKLSDFRIKKLEKIKNWFWICNNKFDEVVLKLKKWVNKHKKMPKLGSDNKHERYLAKWCSNKRYKMNELEKYKIKELERIDGWVWTNTFAENVINYDKWAVSS